MYNTPTTLRNGVSKPMKALDDLFSRCFEGLGSDPLDLFDPFDPPFFYGDIYTDDDSTLYIDVPGFDSNNLNVEYKAGTITVTGENDLGRKIRKRIRTNKDLGEPQSAEVKNGVLKLQFETSQTEDSKKIELK